MLGEEVQKSCSGAGISDSNDYSSHSLRRGFATWSNTQQWDIKALMEYVGWKDIKTALKYIEADDPFLSHYNKSLNLPDNQM
jgi:integrase